MPQPSQFNDLKHAIACVDMASQEVVKARINGTELPVDPQLLLELQQKVSELKLAYLKKHLSSGAQRARLANALGLSRARVSQIAKEG